MHRFFRGVVVGSATAVLVLGASAALAGTGVGGIFNLGKTNTVNGGSALSGATAGAQLTVSNTSASGRAVSLNGSSSNAALLVHNTAGSADAFQTPGNVAPFSVNSTVQVPSLNASLLGGRAASSFLPASAVQRIGRTTIPACTSLSCGSPTLITLGQLTFSAECQAITSPGVQQNVGLELTSSVDGSSWAAMTSLNTTNFSDPNMDAGSPDTLAEETLGSVTTPDFVAVTGDALSADGHEISFDLYMGQNAQGAANGSCVFGGSFVTS